MQIVKSPPKKYVKVLKRSGVVSFQYLNTHWVGGQGQVLQIFKNFVGSIVDLFDPFQLNIIYTKFVKLLCKDFNGGKRMSLFAW